MAQVDDKHTADEVVEQVRKIKETLAKSMDFDIDRILEDAREKQRETSRTVLLPPVRHDA